MTNRDVRFLNTGSPFGWHYNGKITVGSQRFARAAGQGDCPASYRSGLIRGLHDAGRLSTGTDADQHIAGDGKSGHLSRKNFVVAVIVAQGRQGGSISCQRNRWKSTSLFFVPADEFRGNVLRIGGAAAISAKQNLLAGFECIANDATRRLDFGELRREQSLNCFQMFLEGAS